MTTMTDNEFWLAWQTAFLNGLTAFGFDVLSTVRSYNPQDQGPPLDADPTYFVHRITSRPYGWQWRELSYDDVNDQFDNDETYWLEANFQMNVIAQTVIDDANSLTPFDYIDRARVVLQRRGVAPAAVPATLTRVFAEPAAGGVQAPAHRPRLPTINIGYFKDDRGQWDNDPNVEFSLTYQQTATSIVPAADITGEIYSF